MSLLICRTIVCVTLFFSSIAAAQQITVQPPIAPRAQMQWFAGSNNVGTCYTFKPLERPRDVHFMGAPDEGFAVDAFTTGDGGKPRAKTVLSIRYQPGVIEFAFRCETPNPSRLRSAAEAGTQDGPVEKGDYVHLLINDPTKPHVSELWVAPSGAVKDARNGKVDWSQGWDVRTRVEDKAWFVEGRYSAWETTRNDLPEGFLKTFITGKPIAINASRHDMQTNETTALAWPAEDRQRAPLMVMGTNENFREYLDRIMFSRDMKVELFAGSHWFDDVTDGAGRIKITPSTGEAIGGAVVMKLIVVRDGKTVTEARIDPVHAYETDFALPIRALGAGEYTLTLTVTAGDEVIRRIEQPLVIKPATRDVVEQLPLTMTLTRPAPADVEAWHFRTGVPIARGQLTDPAAVTLLRDGKAIDVQTHTLATWGPPGTEDAGSVKWLRLDFVDAVKQGQTPTWSLQFEKPSPVQVRLRVDDRDDRIVIDNGKLQLTINKASRGFNLFNDAVGPYIVDKDGVRYLASADRTATVEVEQSGPLAAVIRAEGWYVNPKATHRQPIEGEPVARPIGGFCRHITRLYIAADQPDVRVQQTFVFTEDSEIETVRDLGIDLPMRRDGAVRFAGVEGDIKGNAFLRQTWHDKFEVGTFVSDTINVTATGEQASGVMQAGDLGVAVLNFWQQYPKELSARPADGSARVHFWPQHGAARIDTTETLTDDNAWLLPWAHSGDAMDFRIPAQLADDKQYPEVASSGYVKAMFKAHALGIAKTHDVLISLKSDHFTERAKVFDAQLHVLADPHYIATTRAFGPITAAEPDKYPLREHWLLNPMKWLVRTKNQYGSFGMWNWGDVQHFWRITESGVTPQYRRLWAGMHHHYVRTPYLQYIRTGDAFVFDHARAHGRHVMDVDVCHWENAAYSDRTKLDGYSKHKRVGGLCDYKGVVHWHSGARSRYNATIDYMLYDYYLTGNRRAWDVAMEHARFVSTDLGSEYGRGAAGQMDTLISLYEATWDESVGNLMRTYASGIMKTPADQHDQKLDWTPWIGHYWDLTHDPQVRDYLMDWVDRYGKGRLNLWAYAYYITGEHKYADHCASAMLADALTTVVREDDYDGIIGRESKGWNDAVNAEMLSLRAIAHANLQLQEFQPDEWGVWTALNINQPSMDRNIAMDTFGGTMPWPDDLPKGKRTTLWFYHDGSPKKVWLGFVQSIPNPLDSTNDIAVYNPSGHVIREVKLQGDYWVIRQNDNELGEVTKRLVLKRGRDVVVRDGKQLEFDKYDRAILATKPWSYDNHWSNCGDSIDLGPNDPIGFYKIVYDGGIFTPVPPLPTTDKTWIEVGGASINSYGGYQFFYVPKTCESFEISFLPGYTRQRFFAKLRMASGAILDPDLNDVAAISCGLEYTPQVITVNVKPEHRGKTWCIAGENYLIANMKGIPPYISPSFDAFAGEPFTPPSK